MTPSPSRQPLTLAQAAEDLGVDQATLRVQIANGRLQARKFGPIWTVTPAELERYRLQSHKVRGRRVNHAEVVAKNDAAIVWGRNRGKGRLTLTVIPRHRGRYSAEVLDSLLLMSEFMAKVRRSVPPELLPAVLEWIASHGPNRRPGGGEGTST